MCACSSGPPARPPAPSPGRAVRPEAHEGLAVAVARRFRWSAVPYEDLLQAARLGLVQAAARFDPHLGIAFATYAVPIMLGEVRRLVDRARPVSGARTARALVARAEAVRQRLERQTSREVTLGEVAGDLGVDAAELAAAIGALSDPLPLEPDPSAAQAGPEPAGAPSPDAWIDRLAVRQALAGLPSEWRAIVYLRYFRGLSQSEAARILGISQPVVSRRERAALALLRHRLEPHPEGGDPWRHLPEG